MDEVQYKILTKSWKAFKVELQGHTKEIGYSTLYEQYLLDFGLQFWNAFL